jgi:hypothetical protein
MTSLKRLTLTFACGALLLSLPSLSYAKSSSSSKKAAKAAEVSSTDDLPWYEQPYEIPAAKAKPAIKAKPATKSKRATDAKPATKAKVPTTAKASARAHRRDPRGRHLKLKNMKLDRRDLLMPTGACTGRCDKTARKGRSLFVPTRESRVKRSL